ncbi:Protein of unknown function [Bacillus cereus]|nr:Protein of unknown function [Bacillus cereus]
MASYVQSDYWL